MSELEHDELMGRIAAELRRPVPIDAGFDARLLAAVRAEARKGRRPGLTSAWSWLVRPRMVAISPVAGLALAAGLVGVVLLSARERGARVSAVTARTEQPPASAPSATASNVAAVHPATVTQLFVYLAPHAKSVALVGDFNGWDAIATPMRASAGGYWTASFPLTPGRHEYAFVVDGRRWVVDPAAPPVASDDFGSPNSVITIADATS